jgi:hypothetical protein
MKKDNMSFKNLGHLMGYIAFPISSMSRRKVGKGLDSAAKALERKHEFSTCISLPTSQSPPV